MNCVGLTRYQLEQYYHISHLQISLIFLSPVIGFIISTLSNNALHTQFGQRGVVFISSACQLTAYIVACLHPPFYALVVVYALVGLGCGSKQAAWNSWVSSLDHANELLGLLHGFYGLGATLTPVIISSLLSKYQWTWYMFYYILVAMAASDLLVSTWAFRHQNAEAYNKLHQTPANTSATNSGNSESRFRVSQRIMRSVSGLPQRLTFLCLRQKVVLLCSGYLLSYVGSEVALGGWLTTFMIDVRHSSAFAAGATTSGLWAGITLGRMALGFVTGRFFRSTKQAVAVYLLVAMVMELLFWLVPHFIASAVFVSFLGKWTSTPTRPLEIGTVAEQTKASS